MALAYEDEAGAEDHGVFMPLTTFEVEFISAVDGVESESRPANPALEVQAFLEHVDGRSGPAHYGVEHTE